MALKPSNRVIIQITVPVILTIVLFIITIQFIVIPTIEDSKISSKKRMIHELVDITEDLIINYHQHELSGELSRELAQSRAIDKLRNLRYGPESDEFFWITDSDQNIVMHPHFSEVENKDASIFIGCSGKDLLERIEAIILEKGKGYIDYVGHSQYNLNITERKLAAIKGFEPWGWIIISGISLEDIDRELLEIKNKLYAAISIIFILILIVSVYIFITSRKIEIQRAFAEKDLRESEIRIRDLIESASDWIWEVDKNGIYIYSSPQIEAILGHKPHEVIGKTPFDFMSPIEAERVGNIFKGLILKNEPIVLLENINIHKNGKQVILETSGVPFYNSSKELVGYRGVDRDITERKIANLKFQKSERKYKEMFDNAIIGMYQTTPGGEILAANPALIKMLGYDSLEELNQINLEDKGNFEEEFSRKKFKDKIEKEGSIIGLESIWKKKDGTSLFIRENAQLVRNEDGIIKFYEGSIEDISTQKKIEQDLLATNEELKATTDALQESNKDLTIALEQARKNKDLALANEKLKRNEKILIKAHEDIKKQKTELEVLNHELENQQEETQQLNEELEAINEHLFTQKEELESTLDKLKETQSQLVQSEKMASVGVLTSGIAHEINNPLNFIQGGKLALENYIKNNLTDHLNNVKPMIEIIDTGVVRASNIVKSLNRFNRKSDKNTDNCDIHSIIDNCLVMIDNHLKHRIEVKKDYSSDNFTIVGNEGKLHQVFINVLTNAEQAIEKEGSIEISTSIEQKKLVISIKDSGCGISKENLSKIADPFFTTKDPGKGTGLGLSITYQIIQDHMGKLNYISTEGIGTTAIIKLPIKK